MYIKIAGSHWTIGCFYMFLSIRLFLYVLVNYAFTRPT